MSFCPLLVNLFLLTLVIKTLGIFFTACVSHNTDTSILKINGCWTLNKTWLSHLNLQFGVVHLLLLSLRLASNNSSLRQSKLKKRPMIYLGKYLFMNGKGFQGLLGGWVPIDALEIFPGPKSFPLGFLSKRC